MLPRALGNAVDGVPSAFPKGKQNEDLFLKLDLIVKRYMKIRTNNKTNNCFKYLDLFFILFTQLGFNLLGL